MKLLVVALMLFVTPAVADDTVPAPNPDPIFHGHWEWRDTVEAGHHLNPKTACKDWAARLKKNGMKYEVTGAKKSSKAGTINDYSCDYINKNDPKKPVNETADAIIYGSYMCPPNATAMSLNNSGALKDHRCKCADGETCRSISPPAPENSMRCTQEKEPKKRSKAEVKKISEANQALAAKGNKQFTKDYKAVADEYANETCAFKPADMYPDAPSDVNIGYLCGKLEADFAAANNMAGFPKTPKGWVWHHHEDMGRMQLVSQEAHQKCGHTGGAKIWSETIGLKEYPNSIAKGAAPPVPDVPAAKVKVKKPKVKVKKQK